MSSNSGDQPKNVIMENTIEADRYIQGKWVSNWFIKDTQNIFESLTQIREDPIGRGALCTYIT
jgi:hypothetical protein